MAKNTRRRATGHTAPKRKRRKLPKVLGVLVVIVGILIVGSLALAATCLRDLPDYDNIDLYAKSGYSTIYASDHKTELGRVTLENRTEIGINECSEYVLEGTVATEDERFYRHSGIDPIGIARAVVNHFTGFQGGRQGASTITQQLVRNTVLLDEMNDISIKRKVREMYIALQVERHYTKEQILMMYLNVVNYGDGCYGIEAASQNYFGCSAADLTLSQAAMLIGIPQSPTANNPRNDYDAALTRSHHVLGRMLVSEDITEEEYERAIADEPELVDAAADEQKSAGIAPYFVDYIKYLLTSDEFNISELSQGALTIYTTIDADCQVYANEAVEQGLQYQDEGLDASLTSIDPDNGHIIAMVGGRDYSKNQFNLSTQMSRQAGSSFKTFALVAALEAGVNPYTTIDASSPADIDGWSVSNSEGQGEGNSTLWAATTGSINTVYARLTHEIGPDKVQAAARACGITSELTPYDSICLGTSGVNTLEMASAYATLAAGGVYHKPVAVLEVLDARGDTIFLHEDDEGEQTVSPAVAQQATEILESVVTSGTGTAAYLSSGQVAAGKTGTSEEGRDLWFCGYTPQLSTAVWVGYRQERATGSYGGSIAAPIWRLFMERALESKPLEMFPTTDEEIVYTDEYTFPQGVDRPEEEEKPEEDKDAAKDDAAPAPVEDTDTDTPADDTGGDTPPDGGETP